MSNCDVCQINPTVTLAGIGFPVCKCDRCHQERECCITLWRSPHTCGLDNFFYDCPGSPMNVRKLYKLTKPELREYEYRDKGK